MSEPNRPEPESPATSDTRAEMLRMKHRLRSELRARRDRQPDRRRLSRVICRRLMDLPEFARARCVMSYVDFSSEVHTRPLLHTLWEQGRTVVVPYCLRDDLGLFRLQSFDELAPSRLGIPEPRGELRARADRRADAAQIDLVVVPGLGFDRQGARLGFGRGYYDRLLSRLRGETRRMGLAFECQLVDHLPLLPHDVPVHMVITERAVYRRPEDL